MKSIKQFFNNIGVLYKIYVKFSETISLYFNLLISKITYNEYVFVF